ncbi:Trichothecene efflux pump TRI12 like protein [Verticillium longisporum]|uniref:Trichothecene efflux pump TRI12 like protein n=1 Tax=Verticillium longisporum TaxID=100787 RepID=A0A8I2ZLE2_VERLO|nr:Trichothecene efflux pump TRI12 like protein [Verticillium longisporum]
MTTSETAHATAATEDSSSMRQHSEVDVEKTRDAVHAENQDMAFVPNDDTEYNVTFKTWIILALSYGISFWIVPALSAAQAVVSAQLGDPTASTWYIPIYTMTVTIAFMICGANSDLFGRRWFIVGGNVLLFIGFIVGGTAKNTTSLIVSCALIGFGAGNAQLAAFALPELLPNKWRHSAIVLADIGVYFAVVVGPVAGRFAIEEGEAWRWLFYAPAIAVVFSFAGLYFYYFPPRHPRGLPFSQALRELDYVGAFLFIVATTLILTGIVYTTTLPSNNPRVIGTLVSGFVLMTLFGLWETFAPLKQPLTPTRIFTRDKGRRLTAPFVAGFVVTMFYYALNVIWPTMIAVFFTDETTDFRYAIVLTLPQNLGLTFGAVLLTLLGSKIGHWRWTLTGSVTVMVVFGALLALGTPDRKGLMIAMIFLSEVGFGWAQYLSIAFIQFGTDQVELGISGGLAGVARFAGGSVAISVYTTILTNVQSTEAARIVPAAATAAGLPESSVAALMAALPLGSAALAQVPGISPDIMAAAGAAFQQSYVVGLRTTALSSLSFGVIGIIACVCCQDIGPRMNDKIEIFLENDENADKNKYH